MKLKKFELLSRTPEIRIFVPYEIEE